MGNFFFIIFHSWYCVRVKIKLRNEEERPEREGGGRQEAREGAKEEEKRKKSIA